MSQLPRFVCRLSMAVVLLMSFTIYAEAADQYPELPRLHQISERLYRGLTSAWRHSTSRRTGN